MKVHHNAIVEACVPARNLVKNIVPQDIGQLIAPRPCYGFGREIRAKGCCRSVWQGLSCALVARRYPRRSSGKATGATPLARMRVLLRLLGATTANVDRCPRFPSSRSPPMTDGATPRGMPTTTDTCEFPIPPVMNTCSVMDRLYDHVIVLDWNSGVAGAGGQRDLPCTWPSRLQPTEGCIAVEPATMRQILPLLSDRMVIRVLR